MTTRGTVGQGGASGARRGGRDGARIAALAALAAFAALLLAPGGCAAEGADGASGEGTDATGSVDTPPGDPGTSPDPTFEVVTGPPGEAPAGSEIPLEFRLRDADGEPAEGIGVAVAVDRGHGSVTPPVAQTDAEGRVSFVWTLGRAPIWNGARVSFPGVTVEAGDVLYVGPVFSVLATLEEPLSAQAFGDVDAWLAEQGINGSTEDLAFHPSGGRLVIGVPGGLADVAPDGTLSAITLTGDAIERPLGVAWDRDGSLWVADIDGKALRHVTFPTRDRGVVETVLTEIDGEALAGPNYVAVNPEDARVYLSDPCLGTIVRYDPDRGAVEGRLDLDLPTEGGPNGLAFEPGSPDRLWFVTENTALLCGHGDVEMDELLGNVFAVDVRLFDGAAGEDEPAFGTPTPVEEGLGHFGDGLAFDVEGNLYTVFDRLDGLTLVSSDVLVRPNGGAASVPFLRTTNALFANLAFGSGDYGVDTLYIALLSVPLVTPASARGLMSYPVGVAGEPLLP